MPFVAAVDSGNDGAATVLLGPSLQCGILRPDRCPTDPETVATTWAHRLLRKGVLETLEMFLKCEGADANAKAFSFTFSLSLSLSHSPHISLM